MHPLSRPAEMMRRMGLLRAAISAASDEEVNLRGGGQSPRRLRVLSGVEGGADKAAVKEFREFCRVVGVGKVRPLSYHEIDRAWRRMEHEAYDGLSFSYAVVAREPKAHGCREVLIDARRTDAQEMVCFLRTLDLDCDGTISEADFCHATNPRVTKFNIDLLGRIDESWQAAAMAEERQLRSARGMNRTGQN